ncbi:putative: casein kinase I isoform delta-like isoform X5 [Tritrichomonas foetus]|uniref:non-specific serine/threonine protein kinase n=1 Tax=Tritrichomonas foetus TaxID=1144522 RepID=A0A1J4JPP9_9EUKA|nr:putative: casein kinase I isoform delta-like isoform X5 [Tritrichomonas foetus]|eukprot:OHT00730.1 putative: casein kinase I isoform delta-like isoform X5 [Tritrichomonas foetus]
MTHFIGGRFRLREKIGSGSFGEIHKGDDVKSGSPVAIKIEQSTCPVPQLANESKAYTDLAGGVNIPRHYFFGTEPTYNAMAIDLEGPSIEDQFKSAGGRFSLKTVLMLVDQMLCSIEFIHKKGFIHRDIKPDNFVFGLKNKENQIFVIDFGLAKHYRNIDGTHIAFREHTPLTGTARYASVNSLSGVEQSRRDDMESLAYIWFYLLKGSLPWMNVSTGNLQAKYDKICAIKRVTTPEELCKDLPSEFGTYLTLIKKLKFDETPDYARYRQMFRDLFMKNNFIYDYKYDWVKYEPKVRSIKKGPAQKTKQPIKLTLKPESKASKENSPKLQLSMDKAVRRKVASSAMNISPKKFDNDKSKQKQAPPPIPNGLNRANVQVNLIQVTNGSNSEKPENMPNQVELKSDNSNENIPVIITNNSTNSNKNLNINKTSNNTITIKNNNNKPTITPTMNSANKPTINSKPTTSSTPSTSTNNTDKNMNKNTKLIVSKRQSPPINAIQAKTKPINNVPSSTNKSPTVNKPPINTNTNKNTNSNNINGNPNKVSANTKPPMNNNNSIKTTLNSSNANRASSMNNKIITKSNNPSENMIINTQSGTNSNMNSCIKGNANNQPTLKTNTPPKPNTTTNSNNKVNNASMNKTNDPPNNTNNANNQTKTTNKPMKLTMRVSSASNILHRVRK